MTLMEIVLFYLTNTKSRFVRISFNRLSNSKTFPDVLQ